ncbi:hypothetical protein [Mucilaginibacter paludis]|uniref:Uncharacterized protein n=1 Tax=Mucilaginibacter paludis DSM 18603 TaxID=714943 RepID=H1YHM1_9SPHI|nr:hypothetical protein [Mucilaginibacter paludis]EHQ26444.1 hypothetical protein Mucpa_2314 [Mucilaginibacter paludis DSM 18603]
MKRNEYFERHPVYNQLAFQSIIGLIQLMIDEGLVDAEERNGFYRDFKDFRKHVAKMYERMEHEQKQEYIAYFRYKHHLYKPFNDV